MPFAYVISWVPPIPPSTSLACNFCSSLHQEVDSFSAPGIWAGLCLALANMVANVTQQRLERHFLTRAGLSCCSWNSVTTRRSLG